MYIFLLVFVAATTSGSTLLDCTNGTSQLLESVDNTITQTEAQVTKTYITVIFILIIVILHFIIFSICQVRNDMPLATHK